MKTVLLDHASTGWRIADLETGIIEDAEYGDPDDAYRAIPEGEALGQTVLARLIRDAIQRSGNFTR